MEAEQYFDKAREYAEEDMRLSEAMQEIEDLRAKLADAYRALVDAEDKNLWDADLQIKARQFVEAENKEKSDG